MFCLSVLQNVFVGFLHDQGQQYQLHFPKTLLRNKILEILQKSFYNKRYIYH